MTNGWMPRRQEDDESGADDAAASGRLDVRRWSACGSAQGFARSQRESVTPRKSEVKVRSDAAPSDEAVAGRDDGIEYTDHRRRWHRTASCGRVGDATVGADLDTGAIGRCC